ICPHCTVDFEPDAELLDSVGITPDEARSIHFRRGKGCRSCHRRGYLGRIAAYEELVMDEAMRRLIMRRAPEAELQEAAENNGMLSLREAALTAVRAGITTPQEMGRVVLTKEGKLLPVFNYSARDATGQLISETMAFRDEMALRHHLRKNNLFVLEIAERRKTTL